MSHLLKLLAGAAGPYFVGAIGVLFAILLGSAAYKSARLDVVTRDLAVAQAALKDPVSKRPWQTLAMERDRDLTICRGNSASLTTQLAHQNASVEALGAASAKATAASNAAVKAAGELSARAERQAGAILDRKPGADLCVSALELAREP